jgi:predicted transcriptional regulator of viral defense system
MGSIRCMEMGKALELLGEHVAEQWGMVTARQAKSLGIDAVTLYRLKDAGFLDLVRRGVYVATSVAIHPHQAEQAAWLALRPDTWAWNREPLHVDDGVLSHDTAARLHGFGELVEGEISFTVPRRRTSRDNDLWFAIDKSLTSEDVALVNGLPVTTMLRTVCDLLDEHIDGSHIATIIREAVEAGQLQLDILADHIAPYARRYRVRPLTGAALLEHLLEQIGLTIDDLATRRRPMRQHSSHLDLLTPVGKSANPITEWLGQSANPITEWLGQNLADLLRHTPAMEQLRKNMSEIAMSQSEGVGRALAELTLQGPGGEELRRQIARSVAAGPPFKASTRDDGPRDELDADDG